LTIRIKRESARAPLKHGRKQRFACGSVIGPQGHRSYRSFIKPWSRFTVGEQHNVRAETIGGSSLAQEFQEATETDRDLAIERVSRWEPTVKVTKNGQAPISFESRQPGLHVVRVRRQDRIGKRIEARVSEPVRGIAPRLPCRRRRARQ
jgi:hypothetical protein